MVWLRLKCDRRRSHWRFHMLDVVEIIAHLLDLFVESVGVAVTDLCPAGDSWTHHRTEGVVRNWLAAFGRVARDENEQGEVRGGMRTRADQIHVTFEDVDE